MKRLVTLLMIGFASYSSVNGADVILNEYNSVAGTRQLDGGAGADSFFGVIDGNGGNWFELLVIGDHIDMRGWKLTWAEDEKVGEGEETATGTIEIHQHDIWSDLRSGSIITFIETVDGDQMEFDTSTDISYDPSQGDWWINVATQEEQAKGAEGLVSATTNDGMPGDFSVGNDDWMLTIFDAAGNTVFGPAGEGIENWPGGKINSEEGGSLEGPIATEDAPLTLETWKAITPENAFYDDTGSTSFGAANVDFADDVFTAIQDLSALRDPVLGPTLKSGDVNGDGVLDAADIDEITLAVRNANNDEKYDLDSSGTVDAEDRRLWVEEIRKTYFGDSNLDSEFGSSDFVAVFTTGEYEDGVVGNSTWATGDWNGDGEFTTTDFVAAFSAGGYELGPRAAVSNVPEPCGFALLLVGGLLLIRREK